MATWVSGDLDKGTDETFDFLCTICERKYKNTEAEKFCEDCQDYLCSVCLKSHNESPFKETHKILDKVHFRPARSASFPAVSTESCKVHGDKPVNMYCKNHDVVGCSTCMVVQHSVCKDKHNVPEYVKNNDIACNLTETAFKLDAIARSLKELQHAILKEKKNLKFSKEMSLKQIRILRKEINKRLDELEQCSVKEIEDRFQSLKSKLKAGQKELQNTIEAVTSAKDSLKTSGKNLSQKFVSIKMADTAASKATEDLKTTRGQVSSTEISFVANQKLQSLLNELQVLGSINQGERLTSQPDGSLPLPQVYNNQTNTKSHESRTELQVPGFFNHTGVLKTRPQGQYQSPLVASIETNTKSHGSKSSKSLMKIKASRKYKVTSFKKCSINDICTLEDGTVILSDYNNRNLKFLDCSTYAVTHIQLVSRQPSSVCSVSNKRVAVCCDRKVIQLMSFGENRYDHNIEIKTDYACDSIAYADGKLFVSHWHDALVSVYTVSGERLLCFGKKLFSAPQGIAVSTDASKIYVADNNNGELVREYKDPELGARGVCCNSNGSVLVWGGSWVLQFSPGGKLLHKVLKTDKECMAVCCNKNNTELIISYYMSNEIEVYDISGK